MNIENFSDLLQAARAQALPQRLLFVFVGAELPDDASPAQRMGFERGEGGALVPALCVDKSPQELLSFDALVQEAGQFAAPWRMVFAAALSGVGLTPPDSEQTDKALNAMVESIQRGEISRYLAFDRQGFPVELE